MNHSWNNLPVPILQQIYDLLTIKHRGRCSQVCRQWYFVFQTDHPWRRFIFHDHLLVRRRFTQHNGWQYALDHMRLRMVIPFLIYRWRELIFEPVENIFNLYEFIMKLAHYSEYQEQFSGHNPLCAIRKFVFTWKLQVQTNNRQGDIEEREIGTGGEILRSLSELLKNVSGLKNLEICNLQLGYGDAEFFLQQLLDLFQEKLFYLSLINITNYYHNPFIHIGLFVNLRCLKISCDLLNDTNIILLADLNYLKKIIIIQDEKSDGYESQIAPYTWRDFKKNNLNRTSLVLVMRGKPKRSMIFQPLAPVKSIIWERSCGSLTEDVADKIVSNYSKTLERFIQVGLERNKRGNKICDRIDKPLISMFIRCSNLRYVSIRERMSTGTALILFTLASLRPSLIHIRKNALLKRLSWTRRELETLPVEIDSAWLRIVSHDYDQTFAWIQNISTSKRAILTDKMYIDNA